ncbi:MAG: pre-peptidase C-terminal domain-containing protein [Pseudomonadota bacterium]
MIRFHIPLLLAALLTAACSGDPGGEPAGTADGAVLPDTSGPPPTGNEPPDLHKIGDKEVVIGETLEIVLEAVDPEGAAVTFSAYGELPPDSKFFKGDARFVWTPAQQGGPYLVTFVASDGSAFDSETVTFRAVTEKQNHAPALQDPGDQFPAAGQPFSLLIQATDQDGDALTLSVQGALPPGATFNAAEALFQWTPTPDLAGNEHRVIFAVTDGQLKDTLDVLFVVTGGADGNQPPQMATIPSQEIAVGKTLVLTIQATDPDGDPLVFGASDTPPGSTWDPVGHALTWTPGPAHANQSFTPKFSVTDGTYTVTKEATILVKSGTAPNSCTPDPFEPNETKAAAAQINPGLFQGLSVCDADAQTFDTDWYSVLITSGTTLTATISFQHDHGDLGLGLFSETGQEALSLSDEVGDQETVQYTVTAAGTYYLVVFANSGNNIKAPYSLEVVTAQGGGCVNDGKEPNNSQGAGTPVGPDTALAGLQICAEDVDWYTLALQAGDSLLASIEFAPGIDLDLYLVAPGGDVLDMSFSGVGVETVGVDPAPVSGTYGVRVEGWPKESAEGTYSLEILASTCPECDGDAKEPNDSQSQAIPLTPGQIVQDLTLCCDADWFQIMVDSGEEIAVDLEYLTEASSKPVVVLTAPGAPAVTLPCTWDGCAGVATAGSTGAAYLKITGPANTLYDVTVTLSGGGGADDSCVGHCNDSAPSGCWCDSNCLEYNDCCADICTVCPDACGA